MITTAQTLFNFILDLLFPITCAQCGIEGEYLCGECAQKLLDDNLNKQICPGCGRHSPIGRTHAECRPTTNLDGLIHAFNYNQPAIKKLIAWFKYQNISHATTAAAKALAQQISHTLSTISPNHKQHDIVLVPIPLHPTRLKWRGYNQAELVANHIAKLLNLTVQTNLLIKTKHTGAQAKLDKANRIANATDSFKVVSTTSPNTFYIIIDDVATTRATLNAASKQLKTARAKFVWAATVAFEP